MKLVLGEAHVAGQFITPPENGRIYGWDIRMEDGRSIATMTACDLDIKERRGLAEQMVAAFNAQSAFYQP